MVPQALRTPVLVAGAGPVGAILALELARHGVPSMLVERSTGPSRHPKMDYVSGRSMELLRRLGLASAIRRRGIGPEHSTDFLWTRGFAEPPVVVWHHPSVDQLRERYTEVNDGTAPVEQYQRVQGSLLEEILRDAARAHPLVDLREGWTLVDAEGDDSGVAATVVDGRTRERRIVAADYLAGCDGAASVVRRCLGITMDDAEPRTEHCSVYFRSGDPALRRYGRAFVTIGDKGLTLVSRDEADAWTASVPVPAGETLLADPLNLVRARLGIDFRVDEVISVAHWEGSLAVADTYRKGRAFIVGDAAHQFYPTGGHGANTGIADAVDLGWKLAALVTGWGGPLLLASYEQERRPVALFNRELCAQQLEVWLRFRRLSRAGASREQLAGVLDQQVHHVDNLGVFFNQRYETSPVICHEPGAPPRWQWSRITPTTWPGGRAAAVRLGDGSEIFDQLGAGFTLVDLSGAGTGERLVESARARGIPITYLATDDGTVRRCWERELVLVRPDQHVAWRGDTAPQAWEDILDRVTGRQTP